MFSLLHRHQKKEPTKWMSAIAGRNKRHSVRQRVRVLALTCASLQAAVTGTLDRRRSLLAGFRDLIGRASGGTRCRGEVEAEETKELERALLCHFANAATETNQ